MISSRAAGRLRAIAVSTALVVLATGAAWVLQRSLNLPNLSIVFLVPVLASAARFGWGASVFTAILSVLVYNYFFVPPIFTFNITSPQDLLALVAFLGVAVVTGNLAVRERAQAQAAAQRETQTAALLALSQQLGQASGVTGAAQAVAQQVAEAVGADTAVWLAQGDAVGEDAVLVAQAGAAPDAGARAGATEAWALAQRGIQVRGATRSGTGAAKGWVFLPLPPAGTNAPTLGLMGVRLGSAAGPTARQPISPETWRLLEALAGQAALGLERARLAQDMEQARLLAETERLRTALLSSVSHDLRTPLAVILGAVTSLEAHGSTYDPATQAELLATVREEAGRLDRFVGNLLNMVRLESGALELNTEWVDVRDLSGAALARLRQPLADYDVRVQVAGDLPLLRLDFVLMEQVLVNLLENAMKHTPPGGCITVRAERVGQSVLLEAANTGAGIPPEDLEHIFDRFYRVQGSDRQRGGTGLGLSIARGIVEAHGGVITARLPAEGPGAIFRIELPVPDAPAVEAEP